VSNDLVRALSVADALRRVSPEHVALADSLSFCREFSDAELTSPGFDAQVAAKVRAATGPTPAERQAEQDAVARARRANGQWTVEDFQQATEAERATARDHGQLTSVGIVPEKQRPKPMDGVVAPTVAQVRRWNSMPPWQAQRERAKWAREVSEANGWSEPTRPVTPTAAPQPRASTRPTNQQIADASARRAALTVDYAGVVTREDCAAAAPHVVGEWLMRGKLSHLGYGAPSRRGGSAA